MEEDELQHDLGALERWIADCARRGWTVPADILSNCKDYVRDHGPPSHCASCGVPVICEEFWTDGSQIPFGHLIHEGERLCKECSVGEPGHEAYHCGIEQTVREQNRYLHQLPQPERRFARGSVEKHAEDSHLACPWAERGEPCEKVEEIKLSRAQRAVERGEREDTNDEHA
jgi:hypothetical protein